MYQMCLVYNNCKKHSSWKIIFATCIFLCTCQALQPSNVASYCQHELDGTSETEQRLASTVRQRDFCPWSQECNGTCPSRCSGNLKSIKGYCTAESKSAQDRCLKGYCLCTPPKLTCYKRERCPCYSDDYDDQQELEGECCIHAIDCILGVGEETESKSCFIGPDDPNFEVRCHDLAVICQVLEDHFCDNSCLISTPPATTLLTQGTTFILKTNLSNIDSGTGSSESPGQSNLIVYIVVPLVMLVLIVAALIVLAACIRRKRNLPESEEKLENFDRYTTVDHPQRTECPPKDDRDSNLDNPLYDMQVLGESTLGSTHSMSPSHTADLNDNTRSYENISPTSSNPTSPTSESSQLLPDSKTSKLGVPVFNALHNKQRGTRSRITFLPRTPSPESEQKMLPGMSEEYEPISPRTSTGDETIPMFDLKSKSIDSGYENATLNADGKLRTKKRNSSGSGYENAMANHENSSEIYDYACPIVSPIIHSTDGNEYATPEVNKVDYNQLQPINRHLDIPNSSGNQYNKLNCSTGVKAVQAEAGGEYSQLRRDGEELAKTKQGIKTLPDVIKVGQKHH